MKKVIVIGLISIIILITSFFALNHYIYTQKQVNEPQTLSMYPIVTLTGEYVCIPPLETSDPRTQQCQIGIKTDTNEYYALDFHRLSQDKPALTPGNRFSANGQITPIETISFDYWHLFPIKGIFSVTDSFQKL